MFMMTASDPSYNRRPALVPMHQSGRSHRFATAIAAAIALGAMLILGGCSTPPPEIKPDATPESLYNTGMTIMTRQSYSDAVKYFNEVERQHPYSIWANKSTLMTAYSRYQVGRYDDAIIALDRFIHLHPGSRDIAYAYYLRALCYYEEISDVHRDQKVTSRAQEALDEVIRRFPKSKFARDALLKRDLTNDQVAGQKMSVGRWYQKTNQHIAAINRFQSVIKKYQTTSHIPEALHRLTESYIVLGLDEEAKKSASVLGHNFPGSEWYIDSYAIMPGIAPRQARKKIADKKRGWLGRTWHSIF